MTCIAAVEGPGGACVAWDSCVTAGELADQRGDKVWRVSPSLAIGAAGDAWAIQALSLDAGPPGPSAGQEAEAWAHGALAHWRTRVLSGHLLPNGEPRPYEVQLLAVVGGQVVTLDPDGYAMRSEYGYAAIGSGTEAALAALAVSVGDPATRAESVVRAVARHRTDVAEPVHLLRVRG